MRGDAPRQISVLTARPTQQAFGVYRGDKMSHAVVTLLRAAPGQPWRRIDGFLTPDDLLAEYHRLMGAPRGSVASR